MDNSSYPTFPPPDRTAVARFSPDKRFTLGSAAGALVALGVALATHDDVGRLLAVIAVVLLAAYAVGDLVFSPRLEASAAGVVIRSPFTRATLQWDEIESVEVVSRLRMGLRNTALEIDAGAVLEEFTRRALSTDPESARDLLLAFRPPA